MTHPDDVVEVVGHRRGGVCDRGFDGWHRGAGCNHRAATAWSCSSLDRAHHAEHFVRACGGVCRGDHVQDLVAGSTHHVCGDLHRVQRTGPSRQSREHRFVHGPQLSAAAPRVTKMVRARRSGCDRRRQRLKRRAAAADVGGRLVANDGESRHDAVDVACPLQPGTRGGGVGSIGSGAVGCGVELSAARRQRGDREEKCDVLVLATRSQKLETVTPMMILSLFEVTSVNAPHGCGNRPDFPLAACRVILTRGELRFARAHER